MSFDDLSISQGMPLERASKALILLHGRGGSAEDILSLGKQLGDSGTYLVAPQAAHHSWYPQSFMADRSANEPWLGSALARVHRLIADIAAVLPTSQIALAGFSQGACLALEAAARFPQRYLGVVAFTGGLIGKTISVEDYQGDLAGTPVFIGTGDNDPHVPLARAQESLKILKKLNAQATLTVYPGLGHRVNSAEIHAARQLFLKA